MCYDIYMRRKSFFLPLITLFVELLVGLLFIIAFLSLLLEIARHHLETFDTTIIAWVYAFRSESLTEVMKFFTFLGGEVFLISGILMFLALIYRKHKISFFNFCVLLVFGTVINLLLKFIYQRPRPDYLPMLFESTYSFPSGHAMNSFIFYSLVGYFIIRNTKNKSVWIVTVVSLSLLIFIIGLSRIYLGVHYPSDVLAGYLSGILWLLLIVVVERTAHKLNVFKKFL